MKEFLVILGVIALMLLIVAFRYRKQIAAAFQIYRMFRRMRAADNKTREVPERAGGADTELVRCARCGSWKPRDEALKFSKGTFYCSSACVNEAMNVR
jgi:hypothetical protein